MHHPFIMVRLALIAAVDLLAYRRPIVRTIYSGQQIGNKHNYDKRVNYSITMPSITMRTGWFSWLRANDKTIIGFVGIVIGAIVVALLFDFVNGFTIQPQPM
jgi:hypothetical protein